MRRLAVAVVAFLAVAGVVYLSTLGCCMLTSAHSSRPKAISLADQLRLTADQRQAIAPLEKSFVSQKENTCKALCAKRAQLIQILKSDEPDPTLLNQLVEEIGQEQMVLEKGTLEHLLAMKKHLNPSQQEKLTQLMTEQLRTACEATACGMTSGCVLKGGKS